MIPLRDSIPNLKPPFAAWTILALNVLVFLGELSLPRPVLFDVMHVFGLVPARYLGAHSVMYTTSAAFEALPFLTHMFLHSGWMHLLLNMWSLWIFADNVEDAMGPLRFVVFYLVCGLCAVGTHMLFFPGSTVPVIGASGAIAGVMGAYFVLYPHSRVLTLIPIFIFPWIVEIPAVFFLGLWFALQFLFGLAGSVGRGGGEGVAFWAHVGGFAAGMALIKLFALRDRCVYCYNRDSRRYERGS
ncbi:Peptidase S54, rhomboid domain containing protein [Desulfovibrio sp. X2]|uniref:rhomboid family intramembrane serine protease n=1 Tax=Desulfovibrio sp. X2 TaxID=941449 RepID=UPI000358DC66|nr:rhomboid family intramembrane serine protease [Desulfovibrio sp. X2]EPR42822.1 Peptidase S54, rhomboid domain containing protein [Desulfovibrio sp. X2]